MMGGVNGALDYVTTMGLGYVTPGVDGAKPTATVTQSTKQVSCRKFLTTHLVSMIPILNCCLHTGRNRLGLLYVRSYVRSCFLPVTLLTRVPLQTSELFWDACSAGGSAIGSVARRPSGLDASGSSSELPCK